MTGLKELQELQVAVNRGGYFRCSICNCVSNENIETEIGDFRQHMSFTHDPKDARHFICIDCDEAINGVLEEYPDEE